MKRKRDSTSEIRNNPIDFMEQKTPHHVKGSLVSVAAVLAVGIGLELLPR